MLKLRYLNDEIDVMKVAPDGLKEYHGEYHIYSFAYDGAGFWMSTTGSDCGRICESDGIFYHFDIDSIKQDKVVEEKANEIEDLFYFDNRLFGIERPLSDIATRIVEIDLS